jgi:hypothetical protein
VKLLVVSFWFLVKEEGEDGGSKRPTTLAVMTRLKKPSSGSGKSGLRANHIEAQAKFNCKLLTNKNLHRQVVS